MRIRSDIWVQGFLRICASNDAMALVARSGHETAGAIFVKICRTDRSARLYGPAPMSFDEPTGDRDLVVVFDDVDRPDAEVDQYLAEQVTFDPDLWIVEVEYCRDIEVLHGWLTARSARSNSFI